MKASPDPSSCEDSSYARCDSESTDEWLLQASNIISENKYTPSTKQLRHLLMPFIRPKYVTSSRTRYLPLSTRDNITKHT